VATVRSPLSKQTSWPFSAGTHEAETCASKIGATRLRNVAGKSDRVARVGGADTDNRLALPRPAPAGLFRFASQSRFQSPKLDCIDT